MKRTEEATDWVNPMVIAKKPNGALRLCMDPKDLNKCIKREHHHIPHKVDIISDLAGAKHFSKLDASQGFYQLELDEESTKLCTMATPFGRYSFRRLPFGISSAPELFHRTMSQMMEGLDGVHVYIDDLLIWGSTKEEHDARLSRVLERVKINNLTLNKSKCQTDLPEITFLGDKLTQNGVSPDDKKLNAIKDMSRPQNKDDIKRTMGLINYLGRFVPRLSTNSSALRSLLHEKTAWE